MGKTQKQKELKENYLIVKETLVANGVEFRVLVQPDKQGNQNERGILLLSRPIAVARKEGDDHRFRELLPENYRVVHTTEYPDIAWCIKDVAGRALEPVHPAPRGRQALLETRAQSMRNKPTKAEDHFKKLLDEAGVPYTFQTVTGNYIPDFILYGSVVVEIDGGYHNTPEQRKADKKRTKSICSSHNYTVIRITNEDVLGGNFPPLIKKLLS